MNPSPGYGRNITPTDHMIAVDIDGMENTHVRIETRRYNSCQ
jgi:hypothetical protein